ncbi:hypothetical protein MKW98_025236 [Papaver atlanticum]|uniref:Uncharacterized protein n=1 Tax=Papaver atlanticum TaxID=357466 RepID=A0AAD4X7R2_9MAGN|nr:hypothetical protein MKW98_025236 [Papaver atlanticum]
MDVAVCTIGVILWLLEMLIVLVVTKLTSLVSQLYHKFINQSSASPSPIREHLGDFIPTVTELSRAGVRFKMGSGSASFLHMKFSDDGVFEIPPISITDGIHRWFRNIIACEHLFNGRTYMGSYASLMDFLINSAEDVELLRKRGIITNYLGCDEDVSNMFNRLCFEVCSERSYYFHLNENVNKYYRKRRNFWKATLKGEYFHNPWSIISFLAAVLLIILTFTSTVFATLSYFIHKS